MIGGRLDLLGLKIDLGTLLDSPEQVRSGLDVLRERLKAAGGRETLSDDAWRQGGVSVSGVITTRGVLGDREFHIGAVPPAAAGRRPGSASRRPSGRKPQRAPDTFEPPADVFDEGHEVLVVADVPGAALEDLEIQLEGRTLSLATRPGTRHGYRKVLTLPAEVDPAGMRTSCQNGVLEVRVPKRRGRA